MAFHLDKISTRAPKELDKEKIKGKTDAILEKIAVLQKILYAQKKFSLLIILQGLDAAGKDGLIGKVFKGLNPLGVNVHGFRKPTEEEAAHDFLWRVHARTPAKGMIGIFNRSHYEEVLVPRVEGQIDAKEVKRRMQDINNFEKLIQHNGTQVLKFYLHISRDEQLERLKERKNNPEKFWKHNDEDWRTRRRWDKYMEGYEELMVCCNQPDWIIVPSDQNWYKEYIVSSEVLRVLKKLPLEYPKQSLVNGH
jgi:PPK2 family polyphosphate:nucleotide phosphotransferase